MANNLQMAALSLAIGLGAIATVPVIASAQEHFARDGWHHHWHHDDDDDWGDDDDHHWHHDWHRGWPGGWFPGYAVPYHHHHHHPRCFEDAWGRIFCYR